jgi:Protein of unknown function (DUF2924)
MTPVAQFTEARQETGGLSRRQHLAAGSRPKAADVEAQIAALEALTTADLRIEWSRLYRATPPTRLSRDLLIRGVSYRVQEQETPPVLDLTVAAPIESVSRSLHAIPVRLDVLAATGENALTRPAAPTREMGATPCVRQPSFP